MGSTLGNIRKFRKRGNDMSNKKNNEQPKDDTYINPQDDDWGFVSGLDD